MFQDRINRRWRNGTAWLLVAGILLQPVITYLVTPWISLDSRGHYVLMCTLEGLQEVLVEDAGGTAVTDEEACPALELFKLVGSARPSGNYQLPVVALRAVAITAPRSESQQSPEPTRAYAIRAPPIA